MKSVSYLFSVRFRRVNNTLCERQLPCKGTGGAHCLWGDGDPKPWPRPFGKDVFLSLQTFCAAGELTPQSGKQLTSRGGLMMKCPRAARTSGLLLLLFGVLCLVGCSSGSPSPSPQTKTLTSIAVTPANPSIAKGKTEQYAATGTYSDGSTQNLTSQATWTSSNPSIATVSTAGLATAVAAGSTTIQASLSGVNGSTGLTVTAAGATLQSIAVTPANPLIAKGMTEQFTATGTYSDGSTQNLTSQATWTSSSSRLRRSALPVWRALLQPGSTND